MILILYFIYHYNCYVVLLLRILTISISKDIVSYKDQRKENKYKYKHKPIMVKFSLNVGNTLPVHGIHLKKETETCLCAFKKEK